MRRSARSKLKTSLIHSAVHQNAISDLIITKHMLGDIINHMINLMAHAF